MKARRAVFLDRDGVLNEFVPDAVEGTPESPLRVEEVRLAAGAAAAARSLARAGFALVCVTNQPAAAKGKVPTEQLREVHGRVTDLLAREGVRLETSRICLHHPQGIVPELSGPCDCRKPAAGMLLDAAQAHDIDLGRSWMVGDSDVDVLAGQAAGCRTVLIEYPGSAHKRSGDVAPDLLAADLATATPELLAADLAAASTRPPASVASSNNQKDFIHPNLDLSSRPMASREHHR